MPTIQYLWTSLVVICFYGNIALVHSHMHWLINVEHWVLFLYRDDKRVHVQYIYYFVEVKIMHYAVSNMYQTCIKHEIDTKNVPHSEICNPFFYQLKEGWQLFSDLNKNMSGRQYSGGNFLSKKLFTTLPSTNFWLCAQVHNWYTINL